MLRHHSPDWPLWLQLFTAQWLDLNISTRLTCFLTLFLLVSNQTSLRLNNARYTSFYPFIYVYIVTRLRSISGVHKISSRIR